MFRILTEKSSHECLSRLGIFFIISIAIISPLKAQNSEVLKGVFQFIMVGDFSPIPKNWKFEAEGCLVKFIQKGETYTMVYSLDLDKANWKSAVTKGELFQVSGGEGLFEMDLDTDDAAATGAFMGSAMAWGVKLGKNSTFSYPMQVTKDRFMNAIKDAAAQCPGQRSKY